MSNEVEYLVRDRQVHIVDEFTGRIMEGRVFSDGLHQAIEAKENVPIKGKLQHWPLLHIRTSSDCTINYVV